MPKATAVDNQGRIKNRVAMTDTNLLLTITVVVFFLLYLFAVLFLGGSFTKPQNFLNILNNNASLIGLGIGLAFGVVQGFLVAHLGIQPFIISLAGMFFAKGMTTIVSKEPIRVRPALKKPLFFVLQGDDRYLISILPPILTRKGFFNGVYQFIWAIIYNMTIHI